ncbi:MAG: type sorting protein, partial [Cytophagaceae bacterium]|nr:type sorting protein [Cytophagaceae bacterium]
IAVANGAALYNLQNNPADNQYTNMYWDVMDYTFGQNNWGMAMICEPVANLPFAVTTSYSQYYKLQPGKWPIGEIVQGPCDKGTHDGLGFGYGPTWEDQFNPTASASSGVFFHRNTNYATNETAIDGIADAILMFALAQKMTSACAPLPVEFLGITVEHQDGVVNIDWSTASETDNVKFEIERSLDGEQFEVIGSTAGALTSNSVKRYRYSDQQVKKGVVYYYRIKQIDADGKYTYSNIQVITMSALEDIYVYPNPFKESITIQCSDMDIGASVVVTDLLGQELEKHTVTSPSLQVGSGLQNGIYLMTILNKQRSQVFKLYKE